MTYIGENTRTMQMGAVGVDTLRALEDGRLRDPFSILGPHGHIVRAFMPGALSIQVVTREDGRHLAELRQQGLSGLFAGCIDEGLPYLLRIEWPSGWQETEDAYSFGLCLSDFDLLLFSQGNHWKLAESFGAQYTQMDGVAGVRFAVWAPNASRVSVVGDFNGWDGRRNPMRWRGEAGVWEIFIPRLSPGTRYKFEIVGPDGQVMPQKADPLARQTEAPPATASVVIDSRPFVWSDDEWSQQRAQRQDSNAPVAIYEVHASSWLRDGTGETDWNALADRLVPYVASLGFTHIELLPIMEHPFGGSWGYQPLAQFAPSARYGSPRDFARFVDFCHENGVGVILDWVPAHFPSDGHGLVYFDGTHLYEHADPREGEHRDWNTVIYNLGRTEVQNFLIASALHWLETYHVDGLRVDAVASMLYRDYSRQEGEWVPNIYGGRENLESIAFLRRLNMIVADRCPGEIGRASCRERV